MAGEITQVYEELAIKHNAAYAAFRSIYEAKNPTPKPRKKNWSDMYVVVGVLVIVLASVLVSGSRTVAEFGGELIGIAAFVMLECSIVAFAFIRTRSHFDKKRMEDVRKLTNRGLWLAFMVALAANIHATLKQNGVVTAEWINTTILLMVAFSAPTLAFISGDIMALEYMRINQRNKEIEESNKSEFEAWAEGLNKSWQSQQSRWGVKIEVENERVVVPRTDGQATRHLSALSEADGQRTDSGHGYGVGYTKRTDARTRVEEYLAVNPEAVSMTARELADVIGVGKTTVADVLKARKRNEV